MSAVDQGRVGELQGQDGAIQPLRLTRKGALASTDAHARYQEANLRGNLYTLTVAAGTPTAYTGAAAGSPLLAIHNPSNSNKAAVVIGVGLGITTFPVITTTSASSVLEAYIGPSATPTGTTSNPLNLATGKPTGSAMLGFSNTALTGSTALTFAHAIATVAAISNATIEVAGLLSSDWTEVAGLLIATPGNEVAVGLRTVPASIVVDCTIVWEEVPYP